MCTLENSIIGPTTSLHQHLDCRYSLRKYQALVHHDYCEESFCQERVDCNQTKMDLVANSIQRALTCKYVVKASEQKVKEQTSDSEGQEIVKVCMRQSVKRITKSLPVLKLSFKKRGP